MALFSVVLLAPSSADLRIAGWFMYFHRIQPICSNACRYKLAAIKLVTPFKEHLEKHYADLADKPFFNGLVTCKFVNAALTHLPPHDSNTDVVFRYAERAYLCNGVGRS